MAVYVEARLPQNVEAGLLQRIAGEGSCDQ